MQSELRIRRLLIVLGLVLLGIACFCPAGASRPRAGCRTTAASHSTTTPLQRRMARAAVRG